MAEMMTFELVSPEARLISTEAEMVVMPGIEGDFAAMHGHAPFVTTLRPGIVTIHGGDNAGEYVITGGFAEVSPSGASLLAEEATLKTDFDPSVLAGKLEAAREAVANATPEAHSALQLVANDLEQLDASFK